MKLVGPLLGLLAAASAPLAATTSSTPSFSVVSTAAPESQASVAIEIDKSARASSYSKVELMTVDGSAIAGVDYKAVDQVVTIANSKLTVTVPVLLITRVGYQGNRQFTVKIRIVRNGTIRVGSAMVTIIETDPAPPAPAPTPQWVSAPLTAGGFARCKVAGGCHSTSAPCPQGLNPPALCSFPDLIAAQGDVMMYAWNGCDAASPCRAVGAFWPQGQYKTSTPYVGVEGWVDEWEGVAPAG